MHDIRFLDETLNINKTPSYHLSIQAGLDGLTFSILDLSALKYIALKHYEITESFTAHEYPEYLKNIISKDEFLTKEFASVYCIWETSRTTLLPSELYDKERLKTYFEFNQVLNDLDELHANYLKFPDAYLIFPIHHEIANEFLRYFPNIKFFNQATSFIEFSLKNIYKEGKSVHVSLQDDFFDLLYIHDQKLFLHNTFSYRNEQDMIYFIMNVYDKLELDPDQNNIFLSGRIQRNSTISDTVKQFIKNVSFANPEQQFQYTHAFDKIPSHYFINLFSLYYCG